MNKLEAKLYFVILPRDPKCNESIVSIQDFQLSEGLEQVEEVIDSKTGKSKKYAEPLIGHGYITSVDSVNMYDEEAVITITKTSPSGNKVFKAKLTKDGYITYKDDDYIVKCGIGKFEMLNENETLSQQKDVYLRNVQRVANLADLKDVRVLPPETKVFDDEPAR